jgi:DNA-binding CsgD family transcriptional regulator
MNRKPNFALRGNIKKLMRKDFGLTNREREILRYLNHGLTAKEIAGLLFISEPTVKTHLGSIYRKLSAKDRAQAVSIAIENHLLD